MGRIPDTYADRFAGTIAGIAPVACLKIARVVRRA
jgi:hypothetical protein